MFSPTQVPLDTGREWDVSTGYPIFEIHTDTELECTEYEEGVVLDEPRLKSSIFGIEYTPPQIAYGLRIKAAGRT